MELDLSVFINSKRDEDASAQARIQRFMVSSLKSYFDEVKTYLWSSDVIEDLNSEAEYSYSRVGDSVEISISQRLENLKSIQNHFEALETNFQQKLNSLEIEFEKSNKFDPIPITELFYYINSMTSLCPVDVIEKNHFRIAICDIIGGGFDRDFAKSLCPLPNKTGFFDLEFYLKCLFEGILLVGIPIRPLKFDSDFSCASLFMSHDIAHSHEIFEHFLGTFAFDKYKIIFNAILNSPDKDILILYLWSLIHESSIDLNHKPVKTWKDLGRFPKTIASDFSNLLIQNKNSFWTLQTIDEISSIKERKISDFYLDLDIDITIGEMSDADPLILFIGLVIHGTNYLSI
jgi:DNA-binding protein H-NS